MKMNINVAKTNMSAHTGPFNSGLKWLGSTALLALLASGSSLTVNAQQDEFPGKRIVNILEEPRHRTMHVDDQVYLLDVQINPGDMTLPHTHNAAIMYTFISNGEGPLYGRVSSVTSYVQENLTHEVENPGPNLFRILAVTNYGEAMGNSTSDRPTGFSTEPQLENDWFRSYRLTLQAGEATPIQDHSNPSVVIQVTEGDVHVTREDGITAELTAMGDWTWRKEDSRYLVRNVGTGPVEVVVNEARR